MFRDVYVHVRCLCEFLIRIDVLSALVGLFKINFIANGGLGTYLSNFDIFFHPIGQSLAMILILMFIMYEKVLCSNKWIVMDIMMAQQC